MVQLASTPEERLARLRARLGDEPAVSRAADRMRMNRPRNILAGVTLHAAARQERGLPLSDLEQSLVEVLRVFITDDEIAAGGNAWGAASASTAAALFPDAVTGLDVETPYTLDDLAADLPRLAAEILAQPNVSIVDVADLPDGGSVDTAEAIAAMVEYGGSAVTVLTGPAVAEDSVASMISLEFQPLRLECVRDTNDQWGGDDEIYWVSGAGSDLRYEDDYRSPVFRSLATGQSRDFPADASMFRGLMQDALTLNIECWEEDNGAIFEELQRQMWKIAQNCASAARSITEHGESQEAAVIAVVAALITWLLGWLTNDDDLVGERSIAISSKAVRHLAAQRADEAPDAIGETLTWDFASSEGHYRLRARTRLVPGEDRNLYTRTWSAAEGWSGEIVVPGSRLAQEHPSVGVDGSVLRLVHRNVDAFLIDRTLSGATWNPYGTVGAGSVTPLSTLVRYNDRMYGVGVTTGGRLLLVSTDGSTWSSRELAFARAGISKGAPALTTFNGILYCGYPSHDDPDTMHAVADFGNGEWKQMGPLGGTSGGRDFAFAVLRNTLYCVFRNQANDLNWATMNIGTFAWRMSSGRLDSGVSAVPALAVVNNEYVACVYRGPGGQDLWWRRTAYGETYWRVPAKLPAAGPAGTGPAAAYFQDRLRIYYRR
ncbi:hypothetical protein ACFZBU_42075 [Embleya sp. NPDC008237]|uniref:hypothetical protein n=1 Tax=Embleya sp. NPDC008237 TaxID=3363978 RepID=UPI0036F15E98